MFPETHPALQQALAERGYTEPTPVQAAVLQPETPGRDLLVSAQTGSGKTVAFGLALAGTLLGDAEQFERAGAPMALIVAPTRELAMQVERELAWLYAYTGARIISCIGGMDARREGEQLERGAHIVVGTPGRLNDHMRRGRLVLSGLRAVVLDEADEMLDMGFREELEALLSAMPAERRTLMFSATIAKDIAALARTFQKEALRIDTVVRDQPHADIEDRAIETAPDETEHAVVNVLRFYESPTALVFCATRDGVRHLQSSLLERGFTSVSLSGELTQNERTRALQLLRDGQARVCVATDVAARGLDLPDLQSVIHADLPTDRANLLHRSGRTGRAGRKGMAVLIVPRSRRRKAESLLLSAGLNATWGPPPGPDDVRAQDRERMLADPLLTEPPSDEDRAMAAALLAGRAAEDLAAALVRLYRARLPAPEEVSAKAVRVDRPARAEREAAGHDGGATTWFSVSLGRTRKADPKWLVPLICRLGGVTKRDIGAIRIFDTDTKFEIRQDLAPAFLAAAQAAAPGESVTVSEAVAPAASSARARPGGSRPTPKSGKPPVRRSRSEKARRRP